MTKDQEALIKLLSVALAGIKMKQIPYAVNWKTVMEMANRQGVNAMVIRPFMIRKRKMISVRNLSHSEF